MLKENANVQNVHEQKKPYHQKHSQSRVLHVKQSALEVQLKRISDRAEKENGLLSRTRKEEDRLRDVSKVILDDSQQQKDAKVIENILQYRDETDLLLTGSGLVEQSDEQYPTQRKALRELQDTSSSADSIQDAIDAISTFFNVKSCGPRIVSSTIAASDTAYFLNKAWEFEIDQDENDSIGASVASVTTQLFVNGIRSKVDSARHSPVALLAEQFIECDRSIKVDKAVTVAEYFMNNIHQFYVAPIRTGAAFLPFANDSLTKVQHSTNSSASRAFEPHATIAIHVGNGTFGGGYGLGVSTTISTTVHVVAVGGTDTIPPKRRLARVRLQLSNKCLFRTLLAQQREEEIALIAGNISELLPRKWNWLARNTTLSFDLIALRSSHAAEDIVFISPDAQSSPQWTQDGKSAQMNPTKREMRDIARVTQPSSAASIGTHNNVVGWGLNAYDVLGYNNESYAEENTVSLHLIQFPGLLDLTRVCRIDCSWYHAIALTDVGLVYTWGSGSEGALGHGTMDTCAVPTRVDKFLEQDPPLLCVDVSCGSDLVGAHSAAVTREGVCFTWGIGIALGQPSSTKDEFTPIPIRQEYFPVGDYDITAAASAEDKTDNQLIEVDDADGEHAYQYENVHSVRCGGAFCIATTVSGKTFAWGAWANGRLGLGQPTTKDTAQPTKARRQSRRRLTNALFGPSSNSKPTRQRYQLSPQLVAVLAKVSVTEFACGEAHALAVGAHGQLFGWGKNSFGQVGNGTLVDQPIPVQLNSFIEPNSYQGNLRFCARPPCIVQVSCGAFHSLATDSMGQLYSWGGKGGTTLGHGSRIEKQEQGNGLEAVAGDSKSNEMSYQTSIPVSNTEIDTHRYLLQSEPWRWPRAVEFFQAENSKIESFSAGVQHTVVQTDTGLVYSWGATFEQDADLMKLNSKSNGNNDPSTTLLKRLSSAKAVERAPELSQHSQDQGEPRLLIKSPDLGGHCISGVACGAWHTLAIVAATNTVSRDLLRSFQEIDHRYGTNSGTGSVSSQSPFGDPSHCDLTLIVGNRTLRCHKAILAARSPIFARLIELEELPGVPTSLLLPDLKFDTALCLLQYLYSDSIVTRLDPNGSLAAALGMVAKEFKLDRLLALCRKAVIEDGKPIPEELDGQDDEEQQALNWLQQQGDGETPYWRIPPSRHSHDLGELLDNPKWSDVRFVVETTGELVSAHQIMLQARSKYFSNLLQGREQPSTTDSSVPLTIQVPESLSCIQRILRYLYTGRAPDAPTTSALLQDWVAASRYELDELRAVCEARMLINKDTCCMILDVAYTVGDRANVLQQRALKVLLNNIGYIYGDPVYEALVRRHPTVTQDIYTASLAREYQVQVASSLEIKAQVGEEVTKRQEKAFAKEHDAALSSEQWKHWLPSQDVLVFLTSVSLVFFVALLATMGNVVQNKEILEYIPWLNGFVLVCAAVGAAMYIN